MKKRVLALIAIFCVLALVVVYVTSSASPFFAKDDWPMFHHDPTHSGYSTSSAPATAALKWIFDTNDNEVWSSPAVVDGRLYVGSQSGNVYCLDANTGHQIWLNFKIAKSVISSPAVVSGYVYLGSGDDNVYCLDAQTGKIVWNYTTGWGVYSSPIVLNGYVYIGSGDGNIYCLSALTGDKKWNYTTADTHTYSDTRFWASGTSSPAIDSGLVYVGGTSFFCLNADSGSLKWSYPAIVGCSPTISGDNVYFTSYNGTAYCLNKDTGALVWSKPEAGPRALSASSAAVANGRVFFGGYGVECLDAQTGAQIWNFSNERYPTDMVPAVAGGYVYFGAQGDKTYCLNAENGNVVWSNATGEFRSSPVVANGVVYVGGRGIFAFGSSSSASIPIQTQFSSPSQTNSTSTPLTTWIAIVIASLVSVAIIILLIYIVKNRYNPTQTKLTKRLIIPITIALVAILLASLFLVLYNNESPSSGGGVTPTEPSTAELPKTLWQTDLVHFATDIAAENGKVFTTTAQGVYGYNAENGSLLWSKDLYAGGTLQLYDGRLYVAAHGSRVFCLDEATGETLRVFSAPTWSSLQTKGLPASFVVAGGKVIVVGDATAVFDAATGLEFWEVSHDLPPDFDWAHPTFPIKPNIILGPASASAQPSNYIFMTGSARINTNNGEMMWQASNRQVEPPVVAGNQVIFWNANPDFNTSYNNGIIIWGHNLVSVDAATGTTLWTYDVGSQFFQPTVYKDLLLFGANNGYFYAVTLYGTLAWKTQVDTQNLMKGENLPIEAKTNSDPAASPVLVNSGDNTVTWTFLISQNQVNGQKDNNQYVGPLTTLSLSNGQILQTTNIQRNGTVTQWSLPKLAYTTHHIFLTAATDLWSISKETGQVLEVKSYDHYALGPAMMNNKVYAATDLYLTAYD